MNRTYLLSFALVLSSFFSTTAAQNGSGKNVVALADDVISVVVSQPNCPIRIDEARIVKQADGKYAFSYRIQNIGAKTIKDYGIARWYSDNTGFVGQGHSKGILRPGDFGGSYVFLSSAELERIKADSSKAPKSQKPVVRIALFMITNIWFTDGSEFDDMVRFQLLEKHLELFEDVYDKLEIRKLSKSI